MARVAVIGEPLRIYGYGLAGAVLCPASDQAEAVRAWPDLPDDIAVAVLTPAAARWLASEIAGRPSVLPVLLPERGTASGTLAGGLTGQVALPDPCGLPDPGGLADTGRLPEPGAPQTDGMP